MGQWRSSTRRQVFECGTGIGLVRARLEHYLRRASAEDNDCHLIVLFEGTFEQPDGSTLHHAHPLVRRVGATGVDQEQIACAGFWLSHSLMQIGRPWLAPSPVSAKRMIEGGAQVEFRWTLGAAITHDRAGGTR